MVRKIIVALAAVTFAGAMAGLPRAPPYNRLTTGKHAKRVRRVKKLRCGYADTGLARRIAAVACSVSASPNACHIGLRLSHRGYRPNLLALAIANARKSAPGAHSLPLTALGAAR
jgi:hypothetical protein